MPRRNATIVLGVIALHIALLWALHTGLLHRVAAVLAPSVLHISVLTLPATPAAAPVAAPPATAPPQPPTQAQPPTPQSAPAVAPSPQPQKPSVASVAAAVAATLATPVATSPAPLAVATSAPGVASAGANAPAPATAAAAPKLELPSSDADYLHNPQPVYPALSKRLGEQGRVVVRVFIDTDGRASQASIQFSSGFERLDQAALDTALQWRYAPGKRAGVPEGMWFDVPFHWQFTR